MNVRTISIALAALSAAALSAGQPSAAAAGARAEQPSTTAVAPSAVFEQRAEQVLAVYNGTSRFAPLLSTAAAARERKSVAKESAKIEKMFAGFSKRLGPALGIDRIEAETPYRGVVFINFEETQLAMRLGIEPAAPHQVLGFTIKK